jgi:uncharacterized phiE125 gp8 family phage protein
MMLVELTTVQSAALPVAEFKDHLRLGTGFSDEGAQDTLLETFLRAAVAAVETWTGQALFERDFGWSVTYWRGADMQALPVAPVSAVVRIVSVDVEGAETVADMDRYRLIPDKHRPLIAGRAAGLPCVPTDGAVRIEFLGGFGPDWSDIPATLAQAVLMLAAYYYEYRHEMQSSGATMPFGVAALLGPWRDVRVGGAVR